MKAKLCTLSKEPLRAPICICRLGNLYNKEEVLKRLMNKSMPKDGFCHIRKLKDVKELCLSGESTGKEEAKGEDEALSLICPITQAQFNGLTRFLAIWKCGHFYANKAISELNSAQSEECLVCQEKYEKGDVVDLTMSEEAKKARTKFLLENGTSKKKRKHKSIDKNGEEIEPEEVE